MGIAEILALLTGATKVLSADGTQSLLKSVTTAIDNHLKAEGFSLDKLNTNQAQIPDPVRRTDQPEE